MSDTGKAHILIGADLIPVAADHGPIITFEIAPNFGHVLGLIDVSLVISRAVQSASGGPTREAVQVANLRCTATGAASLRDALNGALLMLQPVENPEGPKN